MRSKHLFFFILLMAVVELMQSCKPSIPSGYLSKGKMEDILYDIHLAEAMSRNDNNGADQGVMISYKEAILRKHDVTTAEFDSSMVYYMRHTKLLHDIYGNLAERLTDEAKSLGADVSEMNQFGDVGKGDTANVWKGPRAFVLSVNKPFNYMDFSVPVDSGFHKGDRLMLDFDSQFIYQDGMRDGVAVLAVTFSNDSVASSILRVTNSQHYSMQVEDRDSLGIKSVRGYFLLGRGDFSSGDLSSTTIKLMFVQNVRLVRMHPRKVKETPVNTSGDSVSQTPQPLPTPHPQGVPAPQPRPTLVKEPQMVAPDKTIKMTELKPAKLKK